MSTNPPGSGGFLHTHTPVDRSEGANPNAPTYPVPIYSATPEWPTNARLGPIVISSGPTVSLITATGCRINWTTTRVSDTRVEYGTDMSMQSSKTNLALVSGHQVDLTGLTTATLYHYKVISSDGPNTVASANLTFTTA
jgi:hypothetical protein